VCWCVCVLVCWCVGVLVCVCVCGCVGVCVTDLTEEFLMQESQERCYGHVSSRGKV